MNVRRGLARLWIVTLCAWEVWCVWFGYELASAPVPLFKQGLQTNGEIIFPAIALGIGGVLVWGAVAWVWRGLNSN